MSIKLYGYWRSSASYRVRIALNLKQIQYEYIPVHLLKEGGQQRTEDYQRLNPAMLVPTFVDDDEDVTLNQSLAIIEYLDEKYPDTPTLLPKHTLDRARVRMLAQDIASDMQPLINLRVLQKIDAEFSAGDSGKQKWAHDWICKGFSSLEKRLATRAGKYSYGYDVTLADVCLVPQVYSAKRFGVNMADYPLINKIYQNCEALPAFMDAAPDRQIDAE
ncbi:MAG: maleylacetoacetate isomerase [Glaciecola sp.]